MAVCFAGASGGCGAVLRKTIGMRSALLCAYSAEELLIIEQCRAVCGPPGIAFSRVGSWRKTAVAAPLSAKARRGGERARPLSQCLSALTALPKGEPLAVHANFISLPRPLPLTDFPRSGTDSPRPGKNVTAGDKEGEAAKKERRRHGKNPLRHRCAMPPPPKGGGFALLAARSRKAPPSGEQTERVCPP